MQHSFITLMHSPGVENEGEILDPKNEEVKATEQPEESTHMPEKKDFIGKIKEALKEWSNNDQQEQDIDDATP